MIEETCYVCIQIILISNTLIVLASSDRYDCRIIFDKLSVPFVLWWLQIIVIETLRLKPTNLMVNVQFLSEWQAHQYVESIIPVLVLFP